MSVDYILEIMEKLSDLDYKALQGQGHLSKSDNGSPPNFDTSIPLHCGTQLT